VPPGARRVAAVTENRFVSPAKAPTLTLGGRTEGLARSVLLLLVAISTVGPLALNGVLPATSAIMAELATSYGLAQLVLTAYLLATLVSQIVLGPAADRHGRRPVMVGGLLVFALGSVGCALAPSIELLLLARFVQGFGGAVCMFLPRTIVRDVHPRDRAASVIGYMTTAMMIAPMFGPALGGWITDAASWRWMYGGLALLGTALASLAWRYQPETLPGSSVERGFAGGTAAGAAVVDESETLESGDPVLGTDRVGHGSVAGTSGGTGSARATGRGPFVTLVGERAFVGYALLMTGSVGVYYTFLAGAPYVAMESRGLDASSFGRWFALVAIGYLAGNLVAGRFSEHVGVARMIVLGMVPFGLGVAAFWVLSGWSHPLGLFVPMQLVAFSNGVSLPNMISGAMSVRPALAASASGIAGGLQTAFGVLLTLAVGLLLPFGDAWLYALATLCATVTAFGLWFGHGARGTPGSMLARRTS